MEKSKDQVVEDWLGSEELLRGCQNPSRVLAEDDLDTHPESLPEMDAIVVS
jgi:hypothetical protein